MAIAKRILLFFIINFLVVVTLSGILRFFPYFSSYHLQVKDLMFFCLVWGMGGSMILLFFSRGIAKMLMGVKLLSPLSPDPNTRSLFKMLEELSAAAQLPRLPQLGIYPSREVNAFATGPSKSKALIALSAGLTERLSSNEIKAILGHEISHIANGDMVTMTLLQGIVNAFVMFLARILAYFLAGRNEKRRPSYLSYHLFTTLFEVFFMFLGSFAIAFFSRKREFQADRGGAMLAGKENMIEALRTLRILQHIQDAGVNKQAIAALKISAPIKNGLYRLLSTHPSLEERIERLSQNIPA